ncbi:MAG: hypothetical protein JWM41_4385 [Gemmatimonadetes bacterium]|nr:hypothetical protein [Gemmatimonadota bacterium]
MPLTQLLLILLRTLAGAQVVVGIGLWTGHWYGIVGVHRTVGVAFVVTLWVLAGLALARRRSTGVAVVAILWGVGVAAFGFMQQRILPGDLHWIVRVAHLAIGVVAMPIAALLARES